MGRIGVCLAALAVLVSCGAKSTEVTSEKLDLGDFTMGHNIVVAPDLQKGPLSRELPKEQWIASMKDAVDKRFGRYEGERLVHFGINLSGYMLAQRGVPLLLSTKSALILTVTAWDDRAGGKFNAEPREIIVLESFGSGTVVTSSGFTMSAEEQMANLTFNAAREIEQWLHENRACLVDNVPPEVLAECWPTEQDERKRAELERELRR
ncbi:MULTISPECIES: hypothetical protein [unclassified Shimia]|uniref:hypothetical protein n=1 Tax=unclassified Shimia TaxID=2630038 RepID=UPI001ADB5238|nr:MULTISPECIES: hypothetical protein [unclassified Shimia]MBO9474866.1 hypothetical protein [Shimia sp. R10_1]MDA5558149.1 hypothetical protein [Shimia sp. MMG029]